MIQDLLICYEGLEYTPKMNLDNYSRVNYGSGDLVKATCLINVIECLLKERILFFTDNKNVINLTMEDLCVKHYYYEVDLIYLVDILYEHKKFQLNPDLINYFSEYKDIVIVCEKIIGNLVRTMIIEAENREKYESALYFLSEKVAFD